MPYTIREEEKKVTLELNGGVTARDVAELTRHLASTLKSGTAVIVRAGEVDDVDTSILQMLVSLRKTVASLAVDELSEAFANAVDRCALRRELLNESKEVL